VKFINTDGMAFIGPGSEWFWTAVSGIVLAVTFLAIFRQLSLQRSANAREQLDSTDREWGSELFTRCKLEVLLALSDSTEPASVPSAPAQAIALYWERIAALAQGGHLDPRLLHQFNGGACPVWWVALAQFVAKVRIDNQDATEYQGFEWLAVKMAELDRQAGASIFDATLLATQLNDRIATYQGTLRLQQAVRSSVDNVPAVGPARPASAGRGNHPRHKGQETSVQVG
jgi:hypothetical protein